MTALTLNPAAEFFIGTFKLSTENEQIVKTCISKYSVPDSFCEFLSWIVNRIANAIKHIFGCSDWQNAQKAIQENTLGFVEAQKLIQETPDSAVEKQIKENVIETINGRSEKFLSLSFQMHEDNASIDEELKSKLLHLGAGLLKIKETVEKIRARVQA